jgi:hypothetical protein
MEAKTHFAKSEAQHQAMSDAHNALADECEKEGLDGCAKAARACAKVHGGRAMHYKAMAGAVAEKAIADELNKGRAELQPSRVSAVAPPNPALRAVTRSGQPQIEKVQVDPEFEHLVKVADDREE